MDKNMKSMDFLIIANCFLPKDVFNVSDRTQLVDESDICYSV